MLALNNIPGINDNVTDEQLKKMMEDLISENKAIDLKKKILRKDFILKKILQGKIIKGGI